MTWPQQENPLVPTSLAADGTKGADANARGVGRAEHTRPCGRMLWTARAAVAGAQARLLAYARVTDAPEPGIPEAADLLETAADCLARLAGFCGAGKGAGGDQ